jgi:putative hydrolase of the HAD superfamily
MTPTESRANQPLAPIKAVAFDAVGTLIYPQPSVAEAYQSAIQRHCGVEIDTDSVKQTVHRSLKARSLGDDLRTDEAAEHRFWADLVRDLCPDSPGFQTCFDELFEHFSRGASWRCFPDVAETLASLADMGIPLVIASNFDNRLNRVCDEMDELSAVNHRIISSLIGWRKPATQFFQILADELNLPAQQILFVGDDLVNDVQGALNAGMQAAQILRKAEPAGQRPTSEFTTVSTLKQITSVVGQHADSGTGLRGD